jgi:nitrogen regulatory protein P-II 2
MKLVLAVIQPTKLNAVHESLERIEVQRMTIADAQAFGRRPDRFEIYRGRPCPVELLRKVAVEIVVNDDFLARTVGSIEETARTGTAGTPGDGKIFVLPVEQAIQIDDAVRGPGAV